MFVTDGCGSEVVSLKDESSSVQSLKDEFNQRIADAERKAQLACQERDIAKKVTPKPTTTHLSFPVQSVQLFLDIYPGIPL